MFVQFGWRLLFARVSFRISFQVFEYALSTRHHAFLHHQEITVTSIAVKHYDQFYYVDIFVPLILT